MEEYGGADWDDLVNKPNLQKRHAHHQMVITSKRCTRKRLTSTRDKHLGSLINSLTTANSGREKLTINCYIKLQNKLEYYAPEHYTNSHTVGHIPVISHSRVYLQKRRAPGHPDMVVQASLTSGVPDNHQILVNTVSFPLKQHKASGNTSNTLKSSKPIL
ncbi:hypothetical protein CBL_05299 [Carabus blaptoides fortunei]